MISHADIRALLHWLDARVSLPPEVVMLCDRIRDGMAPSESVERLEAGCEFTRWQLLELDDDNGGR